MTSPARWIRTRSPIRKPEPRDLVAIVQRDVGDDHSADAHGLQAPDRGELAGAADLDVDRLERRLGLLGREFVREAPARRACDEAEPLLQVEPVDLVDDAVDVERQIGAGFLDRAIVGEHRVQIVAADEQVGDRDAEALRSASSPLLRVRRAARETRPSRARGSAAAARR